jgi:hypothetical protein
VVGKLAFPRYVLWILALGRRVSNLIQNVKTNMRLDHVWKRDSMCCVTAISSLFKNMHMHLVSVCMYVRPI